MPLKRLAALERKRIADEHKERLDEIKYLQGLLRSPAKLRGVIRGELVALKEKYGDARRTQIVDREKGYHTAHDLVEAEDVTVTLWQSGEVSRTTQPPAIGKLMPQAQWQTSTRAQVAFFAASGQAVLASAHQVPDDRSMPVSGLTALDRAETPIGAVVLPQAEGESSAGYLTLATRGGRIKRVTIEDFVTAASKGAVPAINVDAGDQLGWVMPTSGQDEIILVTRQGKAIRFPEDEIRPMGLSAAGVLAIKLAADDAVVGMGLFQDTAYVVTVTEHGLAKRTKAGEFPTQKRYGGGVQAAKVSERTGFVAAAALAEDGQHLALLTSHGTGVTVPVRAIATMNRSTAGQKKRVDTKESIIEPSSQGIPSALTVLVPSQAPDGGGNRAPAPARRKAAGGETGDGDRPPTRQAKPRAGAERTAAEIKPGAGGKVATGKTTAGKASAAKATAGKTAGVAAAARGTKEAVPVAEGTKPRAGKTTGGRTAAQTAETAKPAGKTAAKGGRTTAEKTSTGKTAADKTSTGKTTAFTMGHRYVAIDALRKAKTTADLDGE
jgi:DNA gyrase subunit A